jgi:hypothetical protein
MDGWSGFIRVHHLVTSTPASECVASSVQRIPARFME